MEPQREFLEEALRLSEQAVRDGVGGPFGAVLVQNGKVVGRGMNRVTSSNDPTAHAEIVAIREASGCLNTFRLHDCELYTSCEPCPMCLGAIYWSRLERVWFANTHRDAADFGFDDAWIYQEIARRPAERSIAMQQIELPTARTAFQLWRDSEEKILY